MVYLSLSGGEHPREVLAELMWDDLSQSRTLANFRRELSLLRKHVGEYLSIGRDSVGLKPDANIWVDARDFEIGLGNGQPHEPLTRKQAKQIKKKLDLYRDEFLRGFHLRAARGFEDWAIVERERFSWLALTALENLTSYYSDRGEHKAGITTAQQLLRLNPLIESAHRKLMNLFAQNNQREQALAQFETCKQILKEELGLEPSAETIVIYEAIRTGDLDTTLVAPLPERPPILEKGAKVAPVFVGREEQLAQLEAQLAKALAGEGRVAFVSGEAGSGKTALVSEFARRALNEHPDLLVASGRCNAYSGQGDAFLPIHQVMETLCCIKNPEWPEAADRLWEAFPQTINTIVTKGPDLIDTLVNTDRLMARVFAAEAKKKNWLDQLKKLVRSDGESPKEHNPQFLNDECSEVLLALSRRFPLLIIFDDLQWVDQASGNLLFHLVRNIPESRILILGMYRPSGVFSKLGGSHSLESVFHEVKAQYGDTEVDLDSISNKDAKAFVDAFLDVELNQLDDSFRKNLFAHAGGHPLFTIELLLAMRDRGDIDQMGKEGWVASSNLSWDKLPAQVEGVIEERLARLDGRSRELLEVASVVGEEFDAQVLTQVLNRDERELHKTVVQELGSQHRLVLEIGRTEIANRTFSLYRFSHNLFQQYLYSELGAGERRLLHKAVAQALEELEPDNLPALAYHYSEAEESEKAVHYLLLVADQARTLYAFDAAIDHYHQALEFMENMGNREQTARTWMKLALSYQNNFDFKASNKAYQEAFALQQQIGELEKVGQLHPAPHAFRYEFTDPRVIDPGFAEDTWFIQIISQLFSGLMVLSPTGDVLPDVVQSWEVLNDGKKYVFHLREDVYWSDGVPVTARDFAFALKRQLNPKTRFLLAPLFYVIKNAQSYHQGELSDSMQVGVRAKDEHTLEIELEKPTAYILQLLAGSVPVPKHVVEKHGSDWTKTANFVSNGAFLLASWERGKSMLLERNPNYHGRFSGNLEQVEITFTNQVEDKLKAYIDDKHDNVYIYGIPLDQQNLARQRYSDEYYSFPYLQTAYVAFDTNSSPFEDPRVRRSFALATDKESLAGKVYAGHVSPATGGFVPPGTPGHSADIGLPFDPDQARRLLAKAGYPDGRGFPEISAIYAPFLTTLLIEYLESQWWDILGIKTHWQTVDWNDFFDLAGTEKHPLWSSGTVASFADPHSFLGGEEWNFRMDKSVHWLHKEYEGLIRKATRVLKQDERIALYRRADQLLIDEVPFLPLFHLRNSLLLKPWVKGFVGAPDG